MSDTSLPFSPLQRREFLQVMAGTALLPAWFLKESRSFGQRPPSGDAGERPSIALIGCGGMGRGDAKNAGRFGKVVAVCDVDAKHAEEASGMFGKAKFYKDFRKLLEDKKIDVVINATPDHWHTLINLAALKAGKDIYSEKPLTLTIDEGKRLVAAVKKSGRVLQTGSQQRSDGRFRLACELVRNGRLGKLTEITTILPAGLNGGPFKPTPVPKELNWDFWQGQAVNHDYVKERAHMTFRYWLDYSGGTMTDWGAHHNDIALWAMGLDRSGPTSIEGKALSKPVEGGYTAPAEYEVVYTYANGVRHRCVSTTAQAQVGRIAARRQVRGARRLDLRDARQARSEQARADQGAAQVEEGRAVREQRPHGEFLRLRPLAQAAHLRGGDRPSVRVAVPPGCHRHPPGPEARMGPGQGGIRGRQGGERVREPRDAQAVEL
jgi:predicted dehydrogenase